MMVKFLQLNEIIHLYEMMRQHTYEHTHTRKNYNKSVYGGKLLDRRLPIHNLIAEIVD